MILFLELIDMKIKYLHSDLEEINMMQPQSFEVTSKEKMVCKLQESLYGLKQTLR